MDISRPFVFLAGLFMMTMFICQIFFAKLDQNVQSYCSDAITNFVDDACASGYISPSSYLEMTRRINNTGNMYNLNLIHEARVLAPYVDKSGKEVKGSYVVSNSTYNKEEILEEMFPSSNKKYYNYPLNNGDHIQVTLSLKEPTMAGRIFALLSGNEIKTIGYSYGGYVGSMEDNGMKK